MDTIVYYHYSVPHQPNELNLNLIGTIIIMLLLPLFISIVVVLLAICPLINLWASISAAKTVRLIQQAEFSTWQYHRNAANLTAYRQARFPKATSL